MAAKKDSGPTKLSPYRSATESAERSGGNGFPRYWKKCTLLGVHLPKCGLPYELTKEEFAAYKKYLLGHLSQVLDRMYEGGHLARPRARLEPHELVMGGRDTHLMLMAGEKQCELAEVTYELCFVEGKKVWCKCERYVCTDGSEYMVCTAM